MQRISNITTNTNTTSNSSYLLHYPPIFIIGRFDLPTSFSEPPSSFEFCPRAFFFFCMVLEIDEIISASGNPPDIYLIFENF